jgi:cell fate regulator YaaT (PSP1 superfamily)
MMTKSRDLERGSRICEIDEDANEFNISHGCYKLDVYDWLKDVPQIPNPFNIVEVRFKNTRKLFFENVNKLPLRIGDIVAVEASPGHDIGIVSLNGELVKNQLKRQGIKLDSEFKKVYRKAKQVDVQKWKQSVELEIPTMLRAREMIKYLHLVMKLGDVEFQGDRTKAIFYYIADERVDFRELIKMMAEEFKIRIEMKQIGARQEAGRLGGIGPCGRELCCTTWLANFKSATTHAARTQELSPNPQKLAGQCGKLKCCINYELATYQYERKNFPDSIVNLNTKQGTARHIKNDILKQIMYYDIMGDNANIMVAVPVDRVKEIMELNKAGKIPETLIDQNTVVIPEKVIDYTNNLNQDSLSRFENKPKKKKNNKNKKKRKNPKNQNNPNVQNSSNKSNNPKNKQNDRKQNPPKA